MSDVTHILSKIEAGDPTAANELLPLVYDELRKLAAARMVAERPDHTLQATALVHEAYLRLVDTAKAQRWNSRGHFFAAAAEAMRRILVDWAREKGSVKRGGEQHRVGLAEGIPAAIQKPEELLVLNESLEKLAAEDRLAAELVKLRVFTGMSVTEAGQALGLSRTAAYDLWTFARAWFTAELALQ